jgi:hypothetical protein
LAGEMYKEGESWPHNWERRYFVLWPKRPCIFGSVADNSQRVQLLFYFKAIDSDMARGVLVVPAESSGGESTSVPAESRGGESTSVHHSCDRPMQMEHYTTEEKTERKGFDCRKLSCDKVIGIAATKDLETHSRVVKLGIRCAMQVPHFNSTHVKFPPVFLTFHLKTDPRVLAF